MPKIFYFYVEQKMVVRWHEAIGDCICIIWQTVFAPTLQEKEPITGLKENFAIDNAAIVDVVVVIGD